MKTKSKKTVSATQKTKSQFDAVPAATDTGSASATVVPVVENRTDESFGGTVKHDMTSTTVIPSAQNTPVVNGSEIIIPGIHRRDLMTSTPGSMWHTHRTEIAAIDLRDPSQCALAAWDVRAEKLFLPGNIESGLSMLVCTDDNKPIGKDYFDKEKKKMVFVRQSFNPDTYSPLFNAEFIGVAEQIIEALQKHGIKHHVATTGSVENRNRVFISIRIEENENFKIGEREFLAYIDCLNSFNKSCNVTFTNSNICVCCANTFRMALRDDSGAFKVSIPHRKNMRAVLADVPKLIELAFKGNENFKNTLRRWSSMEIGATDASNLFAAFVGEGDEEAALSQRSLNQVETLARLFKSGKGNKGETLLDAFSAATEYYTHMSAGDSEDTMKQFESSEFGNASEKKIEFFDCLVGATETSEKFAGVARIGERILIATNKKIAATKLTKAETKAAEAQKAAEALRAKAAEATQAQATPPNQVTQ